MFKRLAYQLGLVSCLVGVGVAQASTAQDLAIDFYGITEFNDVACNDGVDGTRDVIYTLISTIPANIRLFNIGMNPTAEDNSNILTDVNLGGCVMSTGGDIQGATGIINGFSTCDITITITPPICNVGPTEADIRQILHIGVGVGVGHQNADLDHEIHAQVTAIGAGRNFAILDVSNPPATNPDYGDSQLFGDLGIMATGDVFNYFEVDGTTHYATLMPDNIVDAAQSDFTSAYNVFMDVYNYGGCRDRDSIDDGNQIKSGYYCLYSQDENGDAIDVTLTGVINLSGPGNFVFFISPIDQNSSVDTLCAPDENQTGSKSTERMCDLIVQPTAEFVYSYGASAANVYWVLTSSYTPAVFPDDPKYPDPTGIQYSSVFLSGDSTLDGTVLAGAQGSNDGYNYNDGGFATITAEGWEDETGTVAAVVNGSLWSFSSVFKPPVFGPPIPPPGVQLAGTTVNANVE